MVKGFKLQNPKANKVLISRDVIFDEKTMLQRTQEEQKHVSKNYSINEHMVQVELETHDRKDNVQNSRSSSSSGDQQHHSIAINRPNALLGHPPSMVLKIWFLMHSLLVVGILLLFRRQYIAKRRVNEWVLWQRR